EMSSLAGGRSHPPCARDLGDDRGARDRMTARIATNHRGVLDAERADRIAVDEDVMRHHGETPDCAPDREDGCVIDVDPLDLAHRGRADADGERTLENALRQLLAF